MGFAGEAYSDDHIWFIKTHYPLGREVFFTANKAVVCVRNPCDVIPSLFNMWISQNHNTSVPADFDTRFAEDWNRFVLNETTCWRDFHKEWMQIAMTKPVLFFRYED